MVLALAACGGALDGLTGSGAVETGAEEVPQAETPADGIPVVRVEMTDTGLNLPSTVPSGIVAFEHVDGASVLPARLNEGVTMEQFEEGLMVDDGMGAIPLVTLMGNAHNTADNRVIYDLPAGDYVGLQFSEEDGPPAMATFTTGEASSASAPEADVAVELVDFAIVMPSEIQAGPQLWQIANNGEQWHEMAVVKMNDGATIDDVMAMMMSEGEPEGPPPFEDVAFWEPSSNGQTAWVTWDLEPGEYTILCFLPDLLGDFSPHIAHGMVAQFTVTP